MNSLENDVLGKEIWLVAIFDQNLKLITVKTYTDENMARVLKKRLHNLGYVNVAMRHYKEV